MKLTPGPKTILIVEDDADIRSALRVALERRGYVVVAVPDAEAALEPITRTQLDLVVLDFILPRMDGEALLHELSRRGLRPRLPVLMISAYPEAREVASAVAAEGYLPKPFNLPDLLEEVARLA